MDFTDECNIDTKEGVDMLQAYLKRRIDLTEISPDDKSNIQSVDIGFPVSFLKVTHMFASDSKKVYHKLLLKILY